MEHDVIIIGGGAAGCFGAVTAAESGRRVLVIERNERLMLKLGLTGKGRCNLTNNSDTRTLLANIKTNPRFLQSALNAFTSADTIEFFERLGVPLKTERGGRVFPESDKAGDVVGALKKRLNILGVNIIRDRADSLVIENQAVKGVKCGRGAHYAPRVIIATGGLSYPKTGSTGDGYRLASEAGHTIIPPKPALVPLVTREDVSELAGLSLRNVGLTAGEFSGQGELLFTHFGISGPLSLSASCYIRDDKCTVSIDLKPGLDEKKLDVRLLRDFSGNKNKQLQNALDALLPKKLIRPVIIHANIQPDKQVNQVTAAERGRLVAALKGFTLMFAGFRPTDEAIITDGGVDTREINPKNMESKLIRGLRFAGEVIDVAGFTGGFNLQIAFSTAYAAGKD
jgi:hypothetical protein